MQFPESGVKIPEEQQIVVFQWSEYTPGMQPFNTYRFYFRLTGNGVTIERHLLKANSISIPIKDLAGTFGLIEGAQYNWEVVAVQHTEGDDRQYYNNVRNFNPQYGTRVQVVSFNSNFTIVPKASATIVPYQVPPDNPLSGQEPAKETGKPKGTLPEGTQQQQTTVTEKETETEETNYTPIIVGIAAIAAIFFFVD